MNYMDRFAACLKCGETISYFKPSDPRICCGGPMVLVSELVTRLDAAARRLEEMDKSINDEISSKLAERDEWQERLDASEQRVKDLEQENRSQLDLHNEIVRRLQSDVAELEDMRDCKEALRELGRYCGCDHVESPDERQVQVHHIHEAFDRLQQEVERLRGRSVSDLLIRLEVWHKKKYGSVNESATYRKLLEEVGELGEAIMQRDYPHALEEAGDVVAVLSHLVRSVASRAAQPQTTIVDCLRGAVEKVEIRAAEAAGGGE